MLECVKICVFWLTRVRLEIVIRVNTIYIYYYRLNLGIRGLKIALSPNLGSGPQIAKVSFKLARTAALSLLRACKSVSATISLGFSKKNQKMVYCILLFLRIFIKQGFYHLSLFNILLVHKGVSISHW